IHFVKQRKLDGHSRQAAGSVSSLRLRFVFLIAQKQIHKPVAIYTVHRQQSENPKVDAHEINIERVVDIQVADVTRGITAAVRRGRSNELVDRDVAGFGERHREKLDLRGLARLDYDRSNDAIETRTLGCQDITPRFERFKRERTF